MFRKLINYIKGTRGEIKHVNWPSRTQTMNFTFLVIGVSLVVVFLLGVFDVVFNYLLGLII